MMNNLDAVWASLSTADRVVLLGHDRAYLDSDDKARLAAQIGNQRARARAPRKKNRRKGSRRASAVAR